LKEKNEAIIETKSQTKKAQVIFFIPAKNCIKGVYKIKMLIGVEAYKERKAGERRKRINERI
jgi:hypothetical protein